MPTLINTEQERVVFFETLFHATQGYVCIAIAEAATTKQQFREKFFKWPAEVSDLLAYIKKSEQGHNVWFCAQLLNQPLRKKHSVDECFALWADLDTCHPDLVDPKPSVILESSSGRYQAFWPLKKPMPGVLAESYCARIAYAYKDEGVDTSGWDLTQLLRVPYTHNYKYNTRPLVSLSMNGRKFSERDFKDFPEVETHAVHWEPAPQRVLDAETVLDKRHVEPDDYIWTLIKETPKEGADWSVLIWKLIMELFERGLKKEEVYAVAQIAECNKFARDGKPERLWDDVLRADANVRSRTVEIIDDADIPKIYDGNLSWEPGFVEEYIAYAANATDAPEIYHQAGAFMLLSAYLGGGLVIDSNIGQTKTNLWFCILGETTLSRKSTAMRLATSLLDEELLLATEEGSQEGMLDALRGRTGNASVLLRDEVVGMMKGVIQKRYLAGMLEAMTKLYDGETVKRLLRKETIYVRDPVFIFFCGGIKDAFMEVLDEQHLASGFLPRMMFVIGNVDDREIRDLGPSTPKQTGVRYLLQEELQKLRKKYDIAIDVPLVANATEGQIIHKKIPVEAIGTKAGWKRWNDLSNQLLAFSRKGDDNILAPMMDRFAGSVLKMAVLLAGANQEPDEHGKIEWNETHIEHALYYASEWLQYTLEVAKRVGTGPEERLFEKMVEYITVNPGVQRSKFMRKFHLQAIECSRTLETLVQRMAIIVRKDGKAERLYPYGV